MTATEIDAGDGLPLTIPAMLCRHVETRGNHVLLASDETRLTYGEADARSRRIARGFLAAGATKGSHIGLLLPNGSDFIVCALAAMRIGAVLLPFSTLSTADELRQLLTRSDTGFLVAAGQFRGRCYDELLQKAFADLQLTRGQPVRLASAPWLRRVWFTGPGATERHEDCTLEALLSLGESISDDFLEATESRVTPADRMLIIHTSGSTSTPKGVIHCHGALLRHLDNINQVRNFTADDILFSTAPWFWVAGLAFGLFGTFVAGSQIVISNSQVASVVLDLIERERPTLTNGYPPTVAWLAQDPSFAARDFSWLRRGNLWPIMAPDSRPSDPTLRHDLYGTSETGSGLSMSSDESDLPERLRGAAGKLLPGIEGKVVDAETGVECRPGKIGELWVRGPFMMEGYYGKPCSETFEPDGWWRTSDAVMIDEEGFVFLRGRLGNMIKTAGANVAPREVEAVISEVTGGRFSVVLGIPDPKRGQAVIAVVFTDRTGEVDEVLLRKQLAERLSSYKVPRRVLEFSRETMPTLSSGKIDLKTLAKIVEQACEVPAA